ncbi:hypothetical protein BT96DRAFT_977895 [Gymnopus androsaceus JB14]|uniref:Uncharacterized protein n=1 Tax=Gymnopus androsaceus JB14 TaxID=1447944 RepID=A0A6A4HBG0_9AGAR|nr:hypothetical protein BT96DRAFT_977895 [Gymnopus androsaceus JB14]
MPKYLAYSGFSLEPDDFRIFMHSLVTNLYSDMTMLRYVTRYDRWRLIPKEGNYKTGNDFKLLFFPVRAVPYSSPKQCDPELWGPNYLDIAKRDELVDWCSDVAAHWM